jgi:NAD(P)-dependent dehydrogenase (short-subunit alcohol dehydrogenase family)
MRRLENKTALITGAARGIGLAIAHAFAREGASVVLTDIRDEAGRDAAKAVGPSASYERLDVRSNSDWFRCVDALLARHGRLDILVNNAGITGFEQFHQPHDPEHATPDAWRAVFATNAEGTMLGCKHAIRAMRPAGVGSIINLSSRSGVVGIPRAAAYAASKAAVRHHTKSVALYCAEEGLRIRCNCIQPAAILTPMWDPVLGEGEARTQAIARFAASAPLNRFGTPEEVAALAVHLASDESAFTTGAEFNIDGGMLAGSAEPPAPPTPNP